MSAGFSRREDRQPGLPEHQPATSSIVYKSNEEPSYIPAPLEKRLSDLAPIKKMDRTKLVNF
jgi:hypothetical protein